MQNYREYIDFSLTKIITESRRLISKIYDVQYVKSDYKIGDECPKDGWMPFGDKNCLQGKDTHFWLKANFETENPKENFYYILVAKSGREGQASIVNPQSILYLNGEIEQAIDTNHYEILLDADTKYEMLDYFYTGNIAEPLNREYSIVEVYEPAEQLYYDLRVAYDSAMLLPENNHDRRRMLAIICKAIDEVDFRGYNDEAMFEGIARARQIITEDIYEKMCSVDGKPIVNCIGHTHIDVEWLWTRRQTREKMQRSIATAVNLMKRYPEYKFLLSQPELYRYLKEESPQLYNELKLLVEQGRWEPEGSMYLEADCNLISGESLVRQILHGKRFFKQEFDKDNKILFLPDVFGYSAALPQILKKSGIRHFVTSKISWNDTNTIPFDTFMWQGIDGTEIFTNFISTQDFSGESPKRMTTYNGFLTPSQIKGTWNRFGQKEYTNRTFTTFGHGDGGGGPTKEMLEKQRRLSKGLPGMPVTEIELLLPHLDRMREEFDYNCKQNKKVLRWVGELYLEYHRGTYTSMARNKRYNRKCEMMLSKAETLSFIDMLFGGRYDAKTLHENWDIVLHNQFHDILPGSAIKEVYDYTDEDYRQVLNICNDIVNQKLQNICSELTTNGGVFVYNPLGFESKGIIKLKGKTFETKEKISSYGWKVIDAFADNKVFVNNLTVENQYYRLQLDDSGRIKSLYDKTCDREVFLNGNNGNEFQVFEDYPFHEDNWEICDYYDRKAYILDEKAEITHISDGTRSGFSIIKNYGKSVIKQKIWLYSENRRIDFENEIDWHEHHQILKVAFPFDIHTNSATYEIQYGHISRNTHQNTTWDAAKFEVYGHKWVDMSENNYGVSLLNDCKYGYSADGSTLKLTVLKCGTFPNPEADQGKHIFTYSLITHKGDFREAGIINEAYLLNQPMTAFEVGKQNGKLSQEFSLVSCDKQNIIIDAIKKAEDNDSMIVRLYDAFDRRCSAQVKVADGFSSAYLCDLMENEIEELEFSNNTVNVSVSNFEIITLKFKKDTCL